MARIRTIKPEFFRHEDLFAAERETGLPLRVAFAGLWTACDREGRFKWKPRQLKLDCLPHDELDFSRVLDALTTRGFVVKYAADGREFGAIPSWNEHQVINNREAASTIPEPTENNKVLTRAPRVDDACLTPLVQVQGEGKGKEGKGKEDAEPTARIKAVPETPPRTDAELEAELFDRGKKILGASSGGLIKNVLKAKKGNVALARSAIEIASTKQDPREYLGAIIRGRDGPDDARLRGDAW